MYHFSCQFSTFFQIRLDFDTFIITGPSTTTTSTDHLKNIGGMSDGANGGKAVSLRTKCATDTFSVGFAPGVPTLCGTLTGDHCKHFSKYKEAKGNIY